MRANAAPRVWTVVVFPTPPFWFATASTCVTARSVRRARDRAPAPRHAPCAARAKKAAGSGVDAVRVRVKRTRPPFRFRGDGARFEYTTWNVRDVTLPGA